MSHHRGQGGGHCAPFVGLKPRTIEPFGQGAVFRYALRMAPRLVCAQR